MAGSIFSGKYAVQEEIARGGMGVIYKAVHTALGRQVAIKVLNPQYSSDPAFLKRFEREARAMARLDHENVVRVFDVAQDGDSHYIVMEYFPGKDLKHLILDRENISWQEMLKISIQVANALSYAHSQGIIHRDIKPGNIMVEKNGRAKIADFGIAAATDEVSVTATGQIIGTPEYMSPEQAMGEVVDARTDLYSLGMVMYELLTGVTTFQGISRMAIVGKLIYDKEEYNLSFPSDTPPFLQEVIRTLLMKAPASRFRDAATLVARLSPSTANTGSAGIEMPSFQGTGPTPPPIAAQDEGPTVMLEGGVSDETLARPAYIEAKTDILEEAPAPEPVSEEPQPSFSSVTPPPQTPSKKSFIPVVIGGAVILLAIIGALLIRSKPSSAPPLKAEQTTMVAPELIEEASGSRSSLQDVREVQLSIRDMQDKLKVLQKEAEDAGAPNRAPEAFQTAMADAMRGTEIVQDGAQWVNRREYDSAKTTLESALVFLGVAEKAFVRAREAAIINEVPQKKKPVSSPPEKKVVKKPQRSTSVKPVVRPPPPKKKPMPVKPKPPVAVKKPETKKPVKQPVTKKTAPSPKKSNQAVAKNIAPPPKNAPGPLDIQAVGVILEQFKRAYQSQDLATLEKMSKMSKGRANFLERLFKGYLTVEVSISDLSINNQSASATLTIKKLTDQRGNLVLPGENWKTAKLSIPKDGNLWGKIIW